MEISTTIEYPVTVKSVLRGENLLLVVSVAAPYGQKRPRLATHTMEVFDEDLISEIRKTLQLVLERHFAEVVEEAKARAHEAYLVAARRGEEI